MPEDQAHECKEQKGKEMSWDMCCSGDVKIFLVEGVWYCEGGDASMRITFCPFCGKKLAS